MARTKFSNPFKNRTNRFSHLEAGKYHTTSVDEGIYLLYRRGPKKSMWYVRVPAAGEGQRWQRPLGLADDYQDADGRDVLSYVQASDLAKERARESRENHRSMAPRGGHTVKEASEEYVARLEAEGKKSIPEIRRVLDKDILPNWGSVPLQDITEARINGWIARLLRSPRKTRAGKDREIDDSPEGARKRRATAQRKWNVFKAVLNSVTPRWADGREWVGIKNLKDLDPPAHEFPTLAECKHLIRRTNTEFRPVVEATLLTGAAYNELFSMNVQDYYPSTGHVRVFNSKRRPRNVPLTDEGISLFDEHTADKNSDDLIFTRNNGDPWKRGNQHRPLNDANTKAKLSPPITLTRLRHAYGSILLNEGVPLETVSAIMGHSTIYVTAKHYARLLQETIDTQVRDALPSIGRKSKVKRILH